MQRHLVITLSIVSILLVPLVASADWPLQGRAAVSIWASLGTGDIVADGSGGFVIVWRDDRDVDNNLFAQRVDAAGNAVWGHNGIRVCDVPGYQSDPIVVDDGAGGTVVAWLDARTDFEGVYAQRIDADGTALWMPGGVRIVATTDPYYVHAVPDGNGNGGVVLVWEVFNSGNVDIYAQLVDGSGTAVWASNAVVTAAAFSQIYARVVTDGAGGVIVAWEDNRGSSADVYAQRVDDIGSAVWDIDSEPICTTTGIQNAVVIATDGAGGAIVAWQDGRAGDTDVFSQRINSLGTTMWMTNGVAVSAAPDEQWLPRIDSDGMGGAYIAWQDERTGTADVFAQRVNPGGASLWSNGGVPVCTDANGKYFPEIVSDGVDGVIVAWYDTRDVDTDVYAQRLDPEGTLLWDSDGAPVCSLSTSNQSIEGLAPNGNGGAVFLFTDYRDGNSGHYLQRVEDRYGDWGRPEAVVGPVLDVPGDQGGYVSVNWYASQRDRLARSEVLHYSVWRAVVGVPEAPEALVSPADITGDFKETAFRYDAAAGFYWEWMGNQNAYTLPGYALTVPTQYDSTGADPAEHVFQVLAHSFEPSTYWISAPRPGYSVDNVSPGAPLSLAAWRDADVVDLEWSPGLEPVEDLMHYSVYRSASPGVTPGPGNFVGTSPDTSVTDSTASTAQDWYYVVTAVDIHGNESAPSNEVKVDASASAAGDPPAPDRIELSARPNPFNPSTTISYAVPFPGRVTIRIYDVRGALVRALVDGRKPAGKWNVTWNGRDDAGAAAASGVYFVRFQAGGEVTHTRITLLK